jgi:signal peptidase I
MAEIQKIARTSQLPARKPGRGDALWDNVKQFLIAIVLALIIKTSVVEAYKIPTSSMEDTLLVGDFLLANKFIYGARVPIVSWRLPAIHEPQRGDVVIFVWPGDMVTKYIKRCVGVPGDTIVVRDKALFVNSRPFPNPEYSKFIQVGGNGSPVIEPRGPGGQNSRDNFGPYVVPAKNYFMMGDNRDNSYDSRFWGAVNQDLILGEAILIHWSWDDSQFPSPSVSLADPLSVPRVFIFNVGHFFGKVRWTRLFNIIN